MTQIDDDSDDDDWQYMEKVIQNRKDGDDAERTSDNDDDDWDDLEKVIQNRKDGNDAERTGIEEVLNIDDFFQMKNTVSTENLSNSFQLQRAIENSLQDIDNFEEHSTTSSSSSSSSRSTRHPINMIVTPPRASVSPTTPSSSRQQREIIVMKYSSSRLNMNIINSFSDEVLMRVLSLADYTMQRVCRRWSVVQMKVSRFKIVETLTNVSLLEPDTAGQIESELFLLFSERLSNEYRQRARSLIFNLRGNSDLRTRVTSGDLQPNHLVRMESSETATKGLVQQREGRHEINSISVHQ